ncbi:aromatic ring-hydroxylating oxygenase subunit alpha [Sphingomonas profundi]|uniref:aromatic ring-hydroxylating oxygenase subunit alpha n=1 Tax=Alterirhizorhabdus profundi TaxID=2681549 RepID=UPI0012E6F4DB|nr:aromatic ring-hydroxylating dioxygenase subunit alpha [Sphingomonas profundi]
MIYEDMGRRLIDTDSGLVDRAIFADQAIYDKEMAEVFEKSWLFVGHESQIPDKGDYFLSQLGREPVVVTRDAKDEVNVLLNICTHRGMPVCRYDRGNAKLFTCPYHGWTFANNGDLTGVPLRAEGYGAQLDRSKWGLIKARVARYYGSIWATFDEAAPSFEDFLGDMAFWLREFMMAPDGEDDGLEVVDGILKCEIPSNWKFGAENAAGDLYHDVSHKSVQRVGLALTKLRGRHTWDADPAKFKLLNITFPAGGHAVRGNLYENPGRDYQSQWAADPEVDAYFRDAHYARQKRLGEKERLLNRGGIVFPNFVYNAANRTSITSWIPRGPSRTEVWKWIFVPKKAPQAVKDAMRNYLLRYTGPAGMVEQDDFENWGSAQVGANSILARRLPMNYQLRLGDHARWAWPERWIGEGALVDEGVSEHAQRIFYDRWAEMMSGTPQAFRQEAAE